MELNKLLFILLILGYKISYTMDMQQYKIMHEQDNLIQTVKSILIQNNNIDTIDAYKSLAGYLNKKKSELDDSSLIHIYKYLELLKEKIVNIPNPEKIIKKLYKKQKIDLVIILTELIIENNPKNSSFEEIKDLIQQIREKTENADYEDKLGKINLKLHFLIIANNMVNTEPIAILKKKNYTENTQSYLEEIHNISLESEPDLLNSMFISESLEEETNYSDQLKIEQKKLELETRALSQQLDVTKRLEDDVLRLLSFYQDKTDDATIEPLRLMTMQQRRDKEIQFAYQAAQKTMLEEALAHAQEVIKQNKDLLLEKIDNTTSQIQEIEKHQTSLVNQLDMLSEEEKTVKAQLNNILSNKAKVIQYIDMLELKLRNLKEKHERHKKYTHQLASDNFKKALEEGKLLPK